MIFDAFPEYWAGRPSVERMILRLIPEPATVMAELRAGNIDAGQILPDEFENFQRDQRLQALRMPGDVSFWFSFNHQHAFFRDVRVRQAIYHAIDRELMVRTLQKGYGRVVNSPIHPSLWQYNPALQGYAHDPARARTLLSEAGFAPGPGGVLQRDGRPFRVRYTFLSEKRYQDQGLMIQQFLRQVGIDVQLEALERGDFFGRFFTAANSANIEMVGIAWFNLLFPPQFEMDGNFRSTGAFARLFAYANPEIDALLQQATAAPERGTLKTIYFRVQELILRDVPRVMTFRPDELWAVQKRVTMPKVVSLADFFGSIPKWKVQ
jgi:peptide/nickel transport system substrate-binding protein